MVDRHTLPLMAGRVWCPEHLAERYAAFEWWNTNNPTAPILPHGEEMAKGDR